jgi:hypothetical protein
MCYTEQNRLIQPSADFLSHHILNFRYSGRDVCNSHGSESRSNITDQACSIAKIGRKWSLSRAYMIFPLP